MLLRNQTQNLGGANKDWAWNKDTQSKILELLNKYPELRAKYLELMKEIFIMVQKGQANEDIEAYAKEQITKIFSQVPNDERVAELFAELEERAQEAQQFQDFNLDEFRNEVKTFIQTYKEEYKEAAVEEKKELLNYMLASNSKMDELLKRVNNTEIIERLVSRMQKKVDTQIESHEFNFDSVMQDLDEQVDLIEEAQLMHVVDSNLKLESPYALKVKQQFTFTIEDIMVDKRADIDFFEFVTMETDFGSSYKAEEDEGFVVVSDDSITGIAPKSEGKFNYKTQLKYTSFRFGGEAKIYDTNFTLFVGEKYQKQLTKPNIWLVIFVVVLAALTISVLGYMIVQKLRPARVLKYEDFHENSFQERPKSIGRASSDLQKTASDSQD